MSAPRAEPLNKRRLAKRRITCHASAVLNASLIFTFLCLASSAIAVAQAGTSTEVSTFPFSLSSRLVITRACRDILIDGTLQEVLHVTFDASGGRHLTVIFNAQGLTSVGLTSGTEYQVSGPRALDY